MGFSPKRTACKLACETTLKECKEKAEKNKLKEAVCETAYEEGPGPHCMDSLSRELSSKSAG